MTLTPTKRAASGALRSPRISQAGSAAETLPAIVTGLSCLYLVAMIGVAIARLDYPYELEWLEGAVLSSASRLLHGQPMYPPPSLSYIPLNYPPLFHMAAAFAM